MFRSFQIIFRELVGSLLVTEFKVFKIVKVVCGDAAVCVVCVRGAEHKVWCVCVVQSIKCGVCAWCRA